MIESTRSSISADLSCSAGADALTEEARAFPAEPGRVRGEEVELAGRRYLLVPVCAELAAPALRKASGLGKQLTARERQIAELVAEGFVNKQIAAALHISEWTVSTHLRRIFTKLQVETRAAMVSRLWRP